MGISFDWSAIEKMLREKYGFVLESNSKASSNLVWFNLGFGSKENKVVLSYIDKIGVATFGEKKLDGSTETLIDDIKQSFGKTEFNSRFDGSGWTFVFFNKGEEDKADDVLEDLC